MSALENQIGEDTATVRAPADWLELQRNAYPTRRRVTVRELMELAAVAIGAGALAWVI